MLDEARNRRIKLYSRERLLIAIQVAVMLVMSTLFTFRYSIAQQSPLDARKSEPANNAEIPVLDNLQQPIQRFGNAHPMDNLGLVRSFSADGKQLIFSSDYAVTVWNLELNSVDWSLPLESLEGYLAISLDKNSSLKKCPSKRKQNVF